MLLGPLEWMFLSDWRAASTSSHEKEPFEERSYEYIFSELLFVLECNGVLKTEEKIC